MRPGGGSTKGADFERSVAKRFSLWASEGQRDDIFWRTAGSGSRGTTQKAKNQLGDIGAVSELGAQLTAVAVIECKCYKRLDWSACIFTGRGELATFWKKVEAQAREHDRVPILVMKENGRPTLLITNWWQFLSIARLAQITNLGMHIYEFDDFLKLPYKGVVDSLRNRNAPTTHDRPAHDTAPGARVPLRVPVVGPRTRTR